jgi:hypothetical protein
MHFCKCLARLLARTNLSADQHRTSVVCQQVVLGQIDLVLAVFF